MIIGIAYDTRDDYDFDSDVSYYDFTTIAEVSYVKQNIEKCGHEVVLLGNYKKILSMFQNGIFPKVDLVFNMSEGAKSRNREGLIPSLLEMYEIPYTGTDAYGLSICLNKLHSKIMAEYLHIDTPKYFTIFSEADLLQLCPDKYPAVLKPIYEGTSSGVIRILSYDEYLENGKKLFTTYRQPLICEEYIDGREFTVSLVGSGEDIEIIGIVETIRKNGDPIGIFSTDDKICGNCTRTHPHKLDQNIIDKAYNWALKLHKFFDCKDLNRIDYRMDADGQLYFLELNPLPGLSPSSAFPNCCLQYNLKFVDAIKRIIQSAMTRYKESKEL